MKRKWKLMIGVVLLGIAALVIADDFLEACKSMCSGYCRNVHSSDSSLEFRACLVGCGAGCEFNQAGPDPL